MENLSATSSPRGLPPGPHPRRAARRPAERPPAWIVISSRALLSSGKPPPRRVTNAQVTSWNKVRQRLGSAQA